jgi:hypothetical protein
MLRFYRNSIQSKLLEFRLRSVLCRVQTHLLSRICSFTKKDPHCDECGLKFCWFTSFLYHADHMLGSKIEIQLHDN